MDFFTMTIIGAFIMSQSTIIGILYRSNRTLRLSSVNKQNPKQRLDK